MNINITPIIIVGIICMTLVKLAQLGKEEENGGSKRNQGNNNNND